MDHTAEEPHVTVGRAPAVDPNTPLQVIEPQKGWVGINWGEIWRYRELLYFLTWRDVKIRYKQTVLGAAWAILQPLLTVLIFSVIFGQVAKFQEHTGGVPYSIYAYAAMLPWMFFQNAIHSSSNSLVGSSNLITKVYFPRLSIPLAAVGAGLVDLAISSGVFFVMLLVFHPVFTWGLLATPLLLIGTVLLATGVGTLLSALTVEFRDFRYVVPFMVQLWMYATPVIYPPEIVPARWQFLYQLNPLVGLVGGFRSALLGLDFQWGQIGFSFLLSLAFFLGGAAYFRAVERRFADVI